MECWRRGDATSVVAILSGTILGASILPTVMADATTGATARRAASADTAPLPRAAGVAFHASSLGVSWTLEGDYGGRLTMDGSGTLRVSIPVALLRSAPPGDDLEPEPSHLVGLRLGLAESTDGGWRIVRSGPLHEVDRDLGPGQELWLRDVELTLADASSPELLDDGRWLVVIQELRVSGDAGWTTAWTYADADLETIPRLLGWEPEGS